MTTSRKEKNQRKRIKEEKIKEKARRRAIGQAFKDDGRWFSKPTKISYTRRERKQLKMK